MVAFYQHAIAPWMDGTESLSDGEYRVYHVVCQLMYLNNGPIVNHEQGIAGRCKQHPLKFRRHFARLVEIGKLIVRDGKVSNARVENELKKIAGRPRKNQRVSGPTPALPGGGGPGVARGSPGGEPNKPLKSKGPTRKGHVPYNTIKEVSTVEANASTAAAVAAPIYTDSIHELWGEGVPILVSMGVAESKARGVIGRWIKQARGDAQLVLSSIQRARDRRVIDPVPWVTMSISKKGAGNEAAGGKVGFAGFAARIRYGASDREGADPEPFDGR
jgi:hypothetical protein